MTALKGMARQAATDNKWRMYPVLGGIFACALWRTAAGEVMMLDSPASDNPALAATIGLKP